MDYAQHEIDVRQPSQFARWFASRDDRQARARVLVRIRRLSLGHAGDARNIGGGVFELRIHAGPGYRVYFARRGEQLVVLPAGGDKGGQRRDVELARRLALALEED